MNKNKINLVVGVWYPLHGTQIHSSTQHESVFEGLTEKEVSEVIKAHDEFREKLYKILVREPMTPRVKGELSPS